MRWVLGVKLGLAVAMGLAAMPGAGAASALAERLPQLKTMGPPAWLKPGVRLSFYGASATLPHTYSRYVPDENGAWVDKETGERFDREKNYGSAGEGISQLDASVVGSERALFSMRTFLLATQDFGGKRLRPMGTTVAVGPVASCDDWYVNPATLAGLKASHNDQVAILPMPYQLDGQTYDTVAFKHQTDNAYVCSFYDKATGVMVASSSSVRKLTAGEPESTMLQIIRFKGMRQRDVSWANEPAPTWLHTVQRFTAQGTHTLTTNGLAPMVTPLQVVAGVDERGADWFIWHRSATTGGGHGLPPQTTTATMLAGPAQIGGLWMAPGALARFTPGQVLDSDPLIGTQTSVAAVQGNLVQIRETGQSHVIDCLYDSGSGQLQRVRQTEQPMAGTTTVVDLQYSAAQ